MWILAWKDCRAACSRTRTIKTSRSRSNAWWQSCNHANVGICSECTAGEPEVGCDVHWMWLIVLLLLRTLFRMPPGPFFDPSTVCLYCCSYILQPVLEPTGSLNNCFIDEFLSYGEEPCTRLARDPLTWTQISAAGLFLLKNKQSLIKWGWCSFVL